MATKRRRLGYVRLGSGMTEDQRSHLESGHAWFASGPVFASDEERRSCWRQHRRLILREWNRPGRRPAALWDYDAPDALEQHEGEAAAVHALFADARERRLIELQWLDQLRVAAVQATAPEHVPAVAATLGVPAWFSSRHADAALAAVAQDRASRGTVIELQR